MLLCSFIGKATNYKNHLQKSLTCIYKEFYSSYFWGVVLSSAVSLIQSLLSWRLTLAFYCAAKPKHKHANAELWEMQVCVFFFFFFD